MVDTLACRKEPSAASYCIMAPEYEVVRSAKKDRVGQTAKWQLECLQDVKQCSFIAFSPKSRRQKDLHVHSISRLRRP